MILAAGRGVRLQPLTLQRPKPLIRIGTDSLILHLLKRLDMDSRNISRVVINVGYLGEQIITALKEYRFHFEIKYSIEPQTPLGTAAGIRKALPLLGSEPFLCISADIWTDFIFSKLCAIPIDLGHLVLIKKPCSWLKGDFKLAGEDFIYGNIAVLHPQLLLADSKEEALGPLLKWALKEGRCSKEIYDGRWHNVGDARTLAKVRGEHLAHNL